MTGSFEITIDQDCWQDWTVDLADLCQQLLNHVLNSLEFDIDIRQELKDTSIEVSFLFTSNDRIQELNRDFREKDKPTNVLSFPDTPLSAQTLQEANKFGENLCLGDIALAEGVIIEEAKEQDKAAQDHLQHLIIHGLLHLLGFDHIEDDEAEIMEQLEIEILADLGIRNPYL
nr:rRNA maturation RNase YbeY [Sneathiella limimaris]